MGLRISLGGQGGVARGVAILCHDQLSRDGDTMPANSYNPLTCALPNGVIWLHWVTKHLGCHFG